MDLRISPSRGVILDYARNRSGLDDSPFPRAPVEEEIPRKLGKRTRALLLERYAEPHLPARQDLRREGAAMTRFTMASPSPAVSFSRVGIVATYSISW